MRRFTAAAGLVVVGLGLVACGNQTDGGSPSVGSTTSTSTTGTTGGPSATPTAAETPERGVPVVEKTPKPSATPSQQPEARLSSGMLLTGKDVATADPKRGWVVTNAGSDPICGSASTRGNGVKGSLARNFTTDLDASGGQFLTRYESPAAAKAAYEKIVATIKSCKALDPAPTHARKLTENRTLALGNVTTILRWYDYPLPSDPGSEDGGFPYAVTRQGNVVSVLAFREMGKGVAPAHFEALARTAAGHLG
ncbi:hypothetical protein AB0L70_00815 [Kribbella sp. NPDC051952]|uniref:hypothetical protein n=1 Tax=Kribbella sp. NPDC051952 TaxID=3154851 RepID=UPI00341F3881